MTDPRYDPRFQRGWSGELPPSGAAPVPDAPVRDTPVPDAPVRDTPVRDAPARDAPTRYEPTPPPAGPAPRPDAASPLRPDPAPGRVTAPVGSAGPAGSPDGAAPAGEPDLHPADFHDPAPPGRNPFRVALVIGGIVLLVLAGGLIWKSVQPTASNGPQSTIDYVMLQLSQELTPIFVLTGLIALIVAIALGALVRRR